MRIIKRSHEQQTRNLQEFMPSKNQMSSKHSATRRSTRSFRIRGRVQQLESHKALPGLVVEALDNNFMVDRRLSSTNTDIKGRFELHYEKASSGQAFEVQSPDLYLLVKTRDGAPIYVTPDKLQYEVGGTKKLVVQIPKV